jgi:dipeptidase
MCDTQVIRSGNTTLFAKNSDREPGEPQHVRYYPAVRGDATSKVEATYVAVEQVPDRHAVILSQPSWIWGAEMGVNEHGLAIGNEAVFTRVVDRTGKALLGMDILRLALERCRTAGEAIDCIDQLLARYGQAGPAGYRDRNFRYDSSFIVADSDDAWVVETAGQHWVARRVDRFDAISNALCITEDFQRHSRGLHEFARTKRRLDAGGKLNFAGAFDTRFMKFMGRAGERRACSLAMLSALPDPHPAAMAAGLRWHASETEDFARHGNADICMHAGGITRPSQTTASMVAALRPGEPPEIYVTGTSAPCLSLFQPVDFQSFHAAGRKGDDGRLDLWEGFEKVHRRALFDAAFRHQLIASRDRLEFRMFDTALPVEKRREEARQWHREWIGRAAEGAIRYRWYSPYDRFWRARAKVCAGA